MDNLCQIVPPSHQLSGCRTPSADAAISYSDSRIFDIKIITDHIGNLDVKYVAKRTKEHSVTEWADYVIEISHYLNLSHPNILKPIGICPENLQFYMDFYNTLDSVTSIMRFYNKITLRSKKHIAFQLLSAMDYLFMRGHMHCDIKDDNVFYRKIDDEFYHIFLSDFNISVLTPMKDDYINDVIQTIHFRSPEALLTNVYTSSADMWSIGILFLKIFLGIPNIKYTEATHLVGSASLMGRYPIPSELCLNGEYNALIYKNARKIVRDEFFDKDSTWKSIANSQNMGTDFIDLMDKILWYRPSGRTIPRELLKHKFFDDVRGMFVAKEMDPQKTFDYNIYKRENKINYIVPDELIDYSFYFQYAEDMKKSLILDDLSIKIKKNISSKNNPWMMRHLLFFDTSMNSNISWSDRLSCLKMMWEMNYKNVCFQNSFALATIIFDYTICAMDYCVDTSIHELELLAASSLLLSLSLVNFKYVDDTYIIFTEHLKTFLSKQTVDKLDTESIKIMKIWGTLFLPNPVRLANIEIYRYDYYCKSPYIKYLEYIVNILLYLGAHHKYNIETVVYTAIYKYCEVVYILTNKILPITGNVLQHAKAKIASEVLNGNFVDNKLKASVDNCIYDIECVDGKLNPPQTISQNHGGQLCYKSGLPELGNVYGVPADDRRLILQVVFNTFN